MGGGGEGEDGLVVSLGRFEWLNAAALKFLIGLR